MFCNNRLHLFFSHKMNVQIMDNSQKFKFHSKSLTKSFLSPLISEYEILSKTIYKNTNQHKNAIYFKKLQKIKKSISQLINLCKQWTSPSTSYDTIEKLDRLRGLTELIKEVYNR